MAMCVHTANTIFKAIKGYCNERQCETLQLERKIILTIPAERIKFEIDKRLQKLARTARMDGFRPGKVPLDVKKQYGYGVHGRCSAESVSFAKQSMKPA